MSEVIKGIIEEIIFRNDDNGFSVLAIEVDSTEDYSEFLTVKGVFPAINVGEFMEFHGKMVTHKTYGEQFDATYAEVVLPTAEEDIKRYLSSGIIKGVGPSFAARIVDKYGSETLDIIQYNPDYLLSIPGIGKKKLEEIVNSFKEQVESRTAIIFLQKYGLSAKFAIRVYKALGKETEKTVTTNPYKLVDEVDGIGFKMADEIAHKMGISRDSEFRIRSGIKYTLTSSTMFGDSYIPMSELIYKTASVLGAPSEMIEMQLNELIIENKVILETIDDISNVYTPALYYAEKEVASSLSRISCDFESYDIDFDRESAEIEDFYNLKLADMQREAIRSSLEEKLLVITGGPGTGKTTIIRGIIHLYEKMEKKVLLAAPTGRAAKRMTEATKRESKTIHRLLEYTFSEDVGGLYFGKNEEEPLDADLIVIDEVSMVDISLMKYLTAAIKTNTRVILTGDSDQLPSVGAGNVLADIINSDCMKVVRLNEIFRQSEKSLIASNAHRINKGEYPVLNEKGKDFFFMTANKQEDIVEKIKELCSTRLPEYYDVDPTKDIQILTPVKNSIIGTHSLNDKIQAALNPKTAKKVEKLIGNRIFREGDKVMQIKNNYSIKWTDAFGNDGEGVFNGDIGFITEVDEMNKTLTVEFDDEKEVDYSFNDLDDLVHAYAVTVHKSQGSEFPVIVMPISYCAPMLLNRNILYTAITRATSLVVLVGAEKYLKIMIDNADGNRRNSSLDARIKEHFDYFAKT